MTEAGLHKAVREKAYAEHGMINAERGTGWLKIAKLSMQGGMGEGGWMDMGIYIRGGFTIFIELKNPDGGGKSSDLQKFRQAELRALGFHVYEEHEKERCLEIIRTHVELARRWIEDGDSTALAMLAGTAVGVRGQGAVSSNVRGDRKRVLVPAPRTRMR